jgi:hypothetical protein
MRPERGPLSPQVSWFGCNSRTRLSALLLSFYVFANVSASTTALTLLRSNCYGGQGDAREFLKSQLFVNVSASATAFSMALLLFTVS